MNYNTLKKIITRIDKAYNYHYDITGETKKCNYCNIFKSVNDFSINTSTRNNLLHNRCKDCNIKISAKNYMRKSIYIICEESLQTNKYHRLLKSSYEIFNCIGCKFDVIDGKCLKDNYEFCCDRASYWARKYDKVIKQLNDKINIICENEITEELVYIKFLLLKLNSKLIDKFKIKTYDAS